MTTPSRPTPWGMSEIHRRTRDSVSSVRRCYAGIPVREATHARVSSAARKLGFALPPPLATAAERHDAADGGDAP